MRALLALAILFGAFGTASPTAEAGNISPLPDAVTSLVCPPGVTLTGGNTVALLPVEFGGSSVGLTQIQCKYGTLGAPTVTITLALGRDPDTVSPFFGCGRTDNPPFYNSEPAQIQVQVPGIVQSAAGDSGNGAAAVAAELLAAGEKAKIAELCEQEATTKPGPPKVEFLKAKNNSKTVTIRLNALSGGFQPQIAIVRSGTRVRLCNRDPIFHQPVWFDPARHKFRSTTLRPGQCRFFFAKILKNRKGLNKAFDRKTGRLLAPKNKPVCWRLNDKLDGDALGVVYVLREGQGRPTKKDKRIARRFCG